MTRNVKKYLVGLLIFLICFAFDRVSKEVILSSVSDGQFFYEVFSFFNLCFVLNTGVSFGMFAGVQNGQILLSVLTFVIACFVCGTFFLEKNLIKCCSYAIIISGAFGNLYDRIIFGGVVDFLDFHFSQYHWPAFNVADSCICVGVLILMYFEIFRKTKG